MMHALHGAVGHFDVWKPLAASLSIPVRPLDLWRLFDRTSPSLAEAGRLIAARASPGDLLLGYSMGGRLALHALLADPTKWQAAIIVGAHPGLTEGHAARREADEQWAERALHDWRSFLKQWNRQGLLATPSGRWGAPDQLPQAPRSEQRAVAQSFRSWSLGTQANLRPELPKISCPVLWLTGELDPKFTALAAEATSLLPRGRHQILPGCGHRLPWEEPLLFQNAVELFSSSPRNRPHP